MFSALWMTNWKIDFYIWSNTSLIVSSCKYHAAACPPQFHTGEKLCELCYFTEIETLQHKVSLWLHRPAVVLMPNPSLVLQEVVWLTCHLKKHLLRETPTAPPEEREGTDVYTTPGNPLHTTPRPLTCRFIDHQSADSSHFIHLSTWSALMGPGTEGQWAEA